MRNKEKVMVSMDRDMHTKLILISYVQKYRFGDQKASMSHIVIDALNEYFVNHKEDLDQALNLINDIWGEK